MTKIIEMFKPKKYENAIQQDLKYELSVINQRMKNREQDFNMTDNDDLIEALIYEQKALQSRYSFLMKKARETGLTVGVLDNGYNDRRTYD